MSDSKRVSRRMMLGSVAAAGVAALTHAAPVFADGDKKQLGLADFSYIVRQKKENASTAFPRFNNASEMLAHLKELGFGGLQTGGVSWTHDFAKQLRAQHERDAMYLEATLGMPKTDAEAEQLGARIETAKEAGVSVIRSVFTSARRYEFFDSEEPFKKFKEDAWTALQRAATVAAKHRIKVAIENHKDLRAEELADFLKRLGSEWVGVNFDTGNNFALLEDPERTMELLAPYTFTLHLKDIAVEEYADGFLLSEVILGQGFLDLKRIVDTCRHINPQAQFNLEIPARDPLKVPVLTKKYWATFGSVPGTQLAETLSTVRKRKSATPLPRVSHLPLEQQLAFEEDQLKKCLVYAREKLGL